MKKGTTVAYANTPAFTKPAYAHAHLPVLTDMDVPSTTLMQTLHQMLRVKRPHGGAGEARAVAWLANRLPVTMIDGAGNIHVDLRVCGTRTMFTAHTDTVHHGEGDNTIRLDVTPERTLWRAGEGACLGADDGAGVALMMHMIDAGVPGYYVFFRGEECGGLGSTWLDKHWDDVGMADIDHCVSFDRADQMDVITHQAGGRCCSDEFGQALADALTTPDLSLAFAPDSTGVFTDSANLTERIPECTNLSVGYKHQHGDGEYQDVTFLAKLADQLCKVDWAALPVARDPAEREFLGWGTGLHGISAAYTSTKGTAVPTGGYLDAEEEYMYECLEDHVWGRSNPLAYLVADEFGIDDADLDMRQLSIKKASDFGDMLCDGSMSYNDVMLALGKELGILTDI